MDTRPERLDPPAGRSNPSPAERSASAQQIPAAGRAILDPLGQDREGTSRQYGLAVTPIRRLRRLTGTGRRVLERLLTPWAGLNL